MKQPNQLRPIRPVVAGRSIVIALLLSCFALSQQTRAVVPSPDGGYPGFNTAEGQSALFSLSGGSANTAVGWYSLWSTADGSFNTGLGAGTLLFNTIGTENTAIGAAALLFNTAGGNTAIGSRALLNNTTGGMLGIVEDFDVGPNVAVGSEALQSNTIGSANTGVGYQALQSFMTGPAGFEQLGLCTAVGFQALANADGGLGNSSFGYQALVNNTDGSVNTALGIQALSANTTGNSNTATGAFALYSNVEGDFNTASGHSALSSNTSGSSNTAIGVNSLLGNTTGTLNTAVGLNALANNTSGGVNIALGAAAGSNVTTANNVICIGHAGADVDNSCYIGHIFGATAAGGAAVLIGGDGRLGTITSSRRFKDGIKPIGTASEALFSLKPVSFQYKKDIDSTGRSQFGLVAEEVEQVNPELVVHDKEGKPYSVRYEQVNAMLLNEFLKEHKKVEEQEACIAELNSTVKRQERLIAQQQERTETLTAQVKEQTAQIQKVSAHIEMRKAVRTVARNK